MVQDRRPDIVGRIPEVGDLIAYNPPRYKGIELMICVGFVKSGLPILVKRPIYATWEGTEEELIERYKYNTPKTNFVIVNRIYEF